MHIRERFLRGVAYIEAHLGEPLQLGDVAARAGMSPHYFSRLFRVLTGEPFGAYVRARRLTRAAQRLVREGQDVKLIELAFDCQYDSQEAFTRAFKRMFGITPGAYREHPPSERMRWRAPLDAKTLGHLNEVLDMQPEIREIEPFIVVGARERFDQDSKHHIPKLWRRFLERFDQVPHKQPGTTYGVCLNVLGEDGSFDYIAGVEVERVDRLPEGLIAETVPRQTYAVFRHYLRSQSLHEELQETLRWIWGSWLPASAYEYVPGPDLERYPPEFDPEQGKGFLEICVPVRQRA